MSTFLPGRKVSRKAPGPRPRMWWIAFLASALAAVVAFGAEARVHRVEPVRSNPMLSGPRVRPTMPGLLGRGCVCDSVWADSILYTLELPAAVFTYGDTVRMTYTVTNHGRIARTFYFPSGCQNTEGVHDHTGVSVWWENVFCTGEPTEFTLAPDSSKVFIFDWREHARAGNLVLPGWYSAWAALRYPYFPESRVSVGFEIVPYGPQPIQEALAAAAPGDTILLAPGVYYENLVWLAPQADVVLQSEHGASVTVLDGGRRGSAIYLYEAGYNPRIEDLTIAHGRDSQGQDVQDHLAGGVSVLDFTRVQITDCIFLENECDRGGAVCNNRGSGAVLERNLFLRNRATRSGGAIYGPSSNYALSVVHNTFVSNSAPRGAALHDASYMGGISQSRNIFYRNEAEVGGGAVWCEGGSLSNYCNAFWENTPANIEGCPAPTGAIFADPRFCAPCFEDFRLSSDSPCAAENNPMCRQVGAYGIGCLAEGAEAAAPGPGRLSLSPNPFTDRLRIFRWGSPAGTDPTVITIVDAAGRLIWRAETASPSPMLWDGRNLEGMRVLPGVYFVRSAEARGRVESRTAVRIR